MTLPEPILAQVQRLTGRLPGPPRNPVEDERAFELGQEIDKLSLDPSSVRWDIVEAKSCALLAEVAKDLQLVGYTGYAILRREGLGGLLVGIATYTRLLGESWEELYPLRSRGRSAAIGWFLERSLQLLREAVPEADDAVIELTLGELDRLERECESRLGNDRPSVADLRRLLKSLQTSAPPAAEPSPTSDRPAATVLVTMPPSRPTGEETPAELVRRLAGPWLAPITQPTGASALLDSPEATLLAHEMEKLERPIERSSSDPVGDSAPSAVQWSEVIRAADVVLKEGAKDLRVASYFALACAASGDLSAFCAGLATVAGLLEHSWEDLAPSRPRARRNVLIWLAEKLEAQLATVTFSPDDDSRSLELGAVAGHLGAVARERFGESDSEIAKLGPALQGVRLRERAPAAPPQPVDRTPVPPRAAPSPEAPIEPPRISTAQPLSAREVDPGAEEQVQRFVTGTGTALVDLADKLRRASPTDPQAYRLLRIGLWLHVVAPPPVTPQGRTKITAIREAERTRLESDRQASRWADLLHRSELLLRTHRFCLDLHWYTHAALDALGPTAESAGVVVRAELAALLARFPELPRLLHGDGSPLADTRTLAWITQEVLRHPTPAVDGSTSAPSLVPEAIADDAPSLQVLLRALPRAEAITKALESAQTAGTAGAGFFRRLDLAEALLQARDLALARTLYTGLLGDVECHRLDLWEPALAIRVLEGLIHAARGSTPPSSVDPWLGQLSRLAPGRAAQLLNAPPL